jgi:antitoxin component YwqK of YwqJK toxin-antitoxin module
LDGRLHGLSRAWNPNGQLLYEHDYINGTLIP